MLPIFLSNILPFLEKHWQAFVIAALLGTNAVTYEVCAGKTKELNTEKAAHAADIQQFKNAQAAATVQAQAVKLQIETENKEKADAADSAYSNLLVRYRANLVQYTSANKSAPSGPSGGTTAHAPEITDRPSDNPVLSEGSIKISNTDADTCAVNTARLQSAHDWALSFKQ